MVKLRIWLREKSSNSNPDLTSLSFGETNQWLKQVRTFLGSIIKTWVLGWQLSGLPSEKLPQQSSLRSQGFQVPRDRTWIASVPEKTWTGHSSSPSLFLHFKMVVVRPSLQSYHEGKMSSHMKSMLESPTQVGYHLEKINQKGFENKEHIFYSAWAQNPENN